MYTRTDCFSFNWVRCIASIIWNDSEGNWFGQVNGVRYDGETPLATAKATFAAAKAVRDAVAVQASNNSDDLTDVNP